MIHHTTLTPLAAAVKQVRIRLRDYQADVEAKIYQAWNMGARNVMAVMPTGAGKTVLFSKIASDHQGACCLIAHRQELVTQISLSLALFGVRHRIVGPKPVIKFVVAQHVKELGASFYDPNAQVGVAGVDTLLRRADSLRPWLEQVTKWIQDEGHHILRSNKWGKAAELFPNAFGLAVTATPDRADGKGLGRHADGIIDALVEGPTQRQLIDWGFLTDYVIYAPKSDIHLTDDDITASGDYSKKKASAASKRSHIVGDVVASYWQFAAGRKGITFAVDVEDAVKISQAYTGAGVPAEAVDGNTKDEIRAHAILGLRSGRLSNLVNVDLFGEGFDLPTIDVASMARPTASFSLFVQQAGRALRPVYAPGMPLDTVEQRLAAIAAGPKPYAIIIDHVGNVVRHASASECPQTGRLRIELCARQWSLDGRDKRSRGGQSEVPLTSCDNVACGLPYSRFKPRCPHCGHAPEPIGRSKPEQVDGDLALLDPAVLNKMRQEKDAVDRDYVYFPKGAGAAANRAIEANHEKRKESQKLLRDGIARWAGWQTHRGREDREAHRRFFHAFGIDALTAQTLGKREALDLMGKVYEEIAKEQSL